MVGKTVKIGARVVLRNVGRGLFGNVIGGVGVAVAAIMIPVDIATLVKSAMDVNQYEGGRGKSNSNAACRVGKILEDLDDKTEEITAIHDILKKRVK